MTRLRNIYYVVWLAVALLGGCTDGFDSLTPQGYMALKLVAVDLEGAETKAVTPAPNEDAITHLWVLQFDGTGDGATFVSKKEYNNPVTDRLALTDLTPGANQTLVFVGNLNEAVKDFSSGTLADFKALTYTITSESGLFPTAGYIPMTGLWEGTIESNIDGEKPIIATVDMKRTVARISFTLKANLKDGDSFRATSIRLHRVPTTVRLVETPIDGVFPVANFEKIDYPKISDLGTGSNLPKTVIWYMPENRRGTGTATAPKDKNETTAPSGEAASTTYIEVIGDYVTGSVTHVVRYRVWPGGDSTTDYNLCRNSSYVLTTTLKDMTTSSNRVEVYGQAYTGITEPEENDNNINGVPFLENLHSVKQSALDEAVATTQLIVDGENATVRGFVYSTTARTEADLQLGRSDVLAVQETGTFLSGKYSLKLPGMRPSPYGSEPRYIRAFAQVGASGKIGYSEVFTYTPPLEEKPANCFMVIPGQTVMFPPADAVRGMKEITSAELLWQTRDDGADAGNLAISKAEDVVYDGSDIPVIIVHTNPACSAANAVIQGKDAEGTVVWTWHVWVTPYRPQEISADDTSLEGLNVSVNVPLGCVQTYGEKYQEAVGIGHGIMGHNLGSQATSPLFDPDQVVKDPAFHFGMLYQWGSRMPWTPTTKESTTEAVPVFEYSTTSLDQSAVLKDYFAAAPSDSWFVEGGKAANDPCPAGWRVPPVGVFADFSSTNFTPNGSDSNAGRIYRQGEVTAWSFCSGARTGANAFSWVNEFGYTWTATSEESGAYALKFGTNVLEVGSLQSKHLAMPVRCVQ